MLRQKNGVAWVLADCSTRRIGRIVWVLTFIEHAKCTTLLTIDRFEGWIKVGVVVGCACHTCLICRLLEVISTWSNRFTFIAWWTLPRYVWFEDRVWHHVLHLFMQLNSFLESVSLIHDILVFHRNHSIVHVYGLNLSLGLFLILEAGISCSKWVHLIPLAYLIAQSSHFVSHQLVVKIRSWPRILTNLLWNAFKEVSTYHRLEIWLRFVPVELINWSII